MSKRNKKRSAVKAKKRKSRLARINNNKCCRCNSNADYELDNGKFICDNCAQIMGELAED